MEGRNKTRKRVREILESYAAREIRLWAAEMALVDLIDETVEEKTSNELIRRAYGEKLGED